MIRLVLLIVLSLALPVVVSAQTSTPTATPVAAGIAATYNFDLTPQPQFDPSMSHDDIMRSLGVQESYQVGVFGQSGLDYPGNSQLSELVPVVPFGRAASTAFISCSDRNGSTPVAFQQFDGTAATVVNWDWPTYSVCGNLSGPACAAALGDKTTYTYYYSDIGRGSWFTIPYLSFVGAPVGVTAPPSSIYSSTSEWSAKLFFETGSIKSPEAGVIPTWRPEQNNPNAIYDFITSIWNPKEIGRIFDSSVSGRRWYITNVKADEVANFAVQFRMPKIYLNTFKPRLSVCAMRPYEYSPQFAQTAVAKQTVIAGTRTAVAGDVVAPPAPTAPASVDLWDTNLNDMWYGGMIRLKCNPIIGKSSLDHCFVDLYGAAGSVPTVLRSGVHVKVVEFDPTTYQIGRTLAAANFVAARGQWSRLSFETIKSFARTKGIALDPNRMMVQLSCPVGGTNLICVPSVNGGAFTHMYKRSSDEKRPIRSSNSIMRLYGSYPGGVQAYLTATAYKSAKTPTITRFVMTRVPTFTRQPTVIWPTVPPIPPTINTTAQTGATRTAISRSRQTATAAAGRTYGTQTAVARSLQTATAAQATSYANATRVRSTATAQIRATQTAVAVATQYLAATLTAISQEVGTAQATQQAQIDRTATVKAIMDDSDAVIRFNTSEQIEQVKDIAEVGPGAVFDVLVNAASAFDRGLYSSPCNGFPASIGGSDTQAGAYQITQDLANSLCEIRIWLDAQISVIPLVKQILSVIFVILIAVMVMRIIRGSAK